MWHPVYLDEVKELDGSIGPPGFYCCWNDGLVYGDTCAREKDCRRLCSELTARGVTEEHVMAMSDDEWLAVKREIYSTLAW